MWSLLILEQNSVLAGNNYEDRTVERYPNRKVPHPKTFNRLVANGFFKKVVKLSFLEIVNWRKKMASKLLLYQLG